MLMSKSRLEKFLYALYSLDSSDLPKPLSRIEELYSCLVTGGDVPTFEPISRVEKYLMSILGVYDIDPLPNPLSRVEVLLYKLATGDDNLDDFKSFLSEHEELLAEIIRNGGVGGNIDIEYVLHTLSTKYSTLYNTAEKPVKSAILKGRTLVNYAQITSYNFDEYRTPVHNLNEPLKKGGDYTIIMNIVSQTVTNGVIIRFGNNTNYRVYNRLIGVGLHKQLFTAADDFNNFAPYLDNGEYLTGLSAEYNQLMILEGDYTNVDIPFFEDMQSVKMPVLKTTGKNLWYGDKDVYIPTGYAEFDVSLKKGIYYFTGDVDTVYPNGSTVLVFMNTLTGYSRGVDINSQVELGEDCDILRIYTNGWSYTDSIGKPQTIKNLMFTNTYPTSYEPYKSNILTVNEGVELRGVGNVKDELDLMTGELTQQTGNVVLIGDEAWILGDTSKTKTVRYGLGLTGRLKGVTNLLNTVFPIENVFNVDREGLFGSSSDETIYLRINKDKLLSSDESGLKEWLSLNPLNLFYQLSTPIVKTVDLSVVDQDGNNTILSTFNDITYVTLSSEGLIPEAELEVAMKNEEVLNTMSLEMDDISTTQNALQETSNTQSENVDATMIATTEIYEELL